MSLFVTGKMAPSTNLICSTGLPPTSTNTPCLLLVVSTAILLLKSKSPITGTDVPSATVPSCLCPVEALKASRIAFSSLLIGVALITSVATMSAADCLT